MRLSASAFRMLVMFSRKLSVSLAAAHQLDQRRLRSLVINGLVDFNSSEMWITTAGKALVRQYDGQAKWTRKDPTRPLAKVIEDQMVVRSRRRKAS